MPDEIAPRVQIVIPVRGAHEALRLCLSCVAAHTSEPVELTIPCAQPEALAVRIAAHERALPADVVATGSPFTFAQNCNLGAARSESEFLVLLNSDAFVGPGWLDALLAPFADPDVVAVGPMGTNVSGHQGGIGRPGLEGMNHSPEFVAVETRTWFNDAARGRTPYPARRLVGFCLAVRRSAWDACKGFDEVFVNGHEDDDLSLRLNLIGKCVVVPDLLVIHHGSASFAELPDAESNYRRTLEGSGRVFAKKWGPHLRELSAQLDARGIR